MAYLTIKNLSQLKAVIKNGALFEIVEHNKNPEMTGQIRKANVIQTNGFYSIIPNEPNSPISTCNMGRGSWFEYGPASCWKFDNTDEGTVCSAYSSVGDSLIWKIKLFYVQEG